MHNTVMRKTQEITEGLPFVSAETRLKVIPEFATARSMRVACGVSSHCDASHDNTAKRYVSSRSKTSDIHDE